MKLHTLSLSLTQRQRQGMYHPPFFTEFSTQRRDSRDGFFYGFLLCFLILRTEIRKVQELRFKTEISVLIHKRDSLKLCVCVRARACPNTRRRDSSSSHFLPPSPRPATAHPFSFSLALFLSHTCLHELATLFRHCPLQIHSVDLRHRSVNIAD